jgi:YD repeat-containing protein
MLVGGGNVTQIAYDSSDRLASETDPLNRLVSETDRNGRIITYTFNWPDELLTET